MGRLVEKILISYHSEIFVISCASFCSLSIFYYYWVQHNSRDSSSHSISTPWNSNFHDNEMKCSLQGPGHSTAAREHSPSPTYSPNFTTRNPLNSKSKVTSFAIASC